MKLRQFATHCLNELHFEPCLQLKSIGWGCIDCNCIWSLSQQAFCRKPNKNFLNVVYHRYYLSLLIYDRVFLFLFDFISPACAVVYQTLALVFHSYENKVADRKLALNVFPKSGSKQLHWITNSAL